MAKRGTRRVCVCTGTRSEYGILRPVMRAIARQGGLTLQVVAAGMHLSPEFGHTIDDIVADGFTVAARVAMLPEKDTRAAMAESVGRGIIGFTRVFEGLRSDIVVVLGDRTEAFAAATAAVLSGRVLAHIHGGDRAEGGYDDYMRHAITKLAHVHFAATKGAARRIERLGEPKSRIIVTGAPGLDEIHPSKLPSPASTKRALGIPTGLDLVLCVQHSISTHPETAAAEMTETLKALAELHMPAVVVYPNSDAGGRTIIKVIESFKRGHAYDTKDSTGWLIARKNLPRDEYLAVMKAARVMVGNSSSGIIEAASFGLPVVNVGRRQAGRERSGNTVDVPPKRNAILRAIRKFFSEEGLPNRRRLTKNVYGDGRASQRIAHALARLRVGPAIYRKQITY